jgi:hypothetical protein
LHIKSGKTDSLSFLLQNSWALHDLQSKESGELPVLQVYDLAPLSEQSMAQIDVSSEEPEKEVDSTTYETNEENANEETEGVGQMKPKYGFLTVAQRRSDVISQDFLHPFSHRPFGTPLLLRVDNLDNCSGRDIYNLVARRLKNFVPKAAKKFLVGSDRAPQEESLTEKTQNSGVTTTDMEEVSGGSVPRYGFRLRRTTRDGRRCCVCPWFECCIGCLVDDTDETGVVADSDTLVVDWHFVVDMATAGFGTRASPLDPISRQSSSSVKPRAYHVPIKNHSSCGGSKKSGSGVTITLEDCLDAFAKEEKIPDAYCSKCKDIRIQTKRLSLWRLPPVLIIHLKRFQHTETMRRKLRDHVEFPMEGLDLSRIMATDTRVTEEQPNSDVQLDTKTKSVTESDCGSTEPGVIKDKGREEMLYDLYSVIHHQGALHGGHYVASVKSELDGHWRLYNDAQIYEIHARDVVDTSAYMLFYIRRDVAKAKLSDFWDVRAMGEGISEEDIEMLVKGSRTERGCIIS